MMSEEPKEYHMDRVPNFCIDCLNFIEKIETVACKKNNHFLLEAYAKKGGICTDFKEGRLSK